MASPLSINAETLTQGRPLDAPEGIRRALPFALGASLALALLAIRNGGGHELTVVLCAVGILAIALAAFLVRWEKLPPVAQVVVPLAYFVVVALMRDVSGGAASAFLVAVLLPVAWLAFYGTLPQLAVGLLSEAVLFIAPVALIGAPDYPSSDLASATLWLLLTGILALVVNQLIRELERSTTRSMKATEEVRRTEGVTQRIIKNANDAYISTDAAGLIIDWNPMAERIFGWTAAEIVGRPLSETIVPERLREGHEHALARMAGGGDPRKSGVINNRIELAAVDRAGREFPVELTISRVDGSERVAFTAFLHDISERRRTEHFLHAQHAIDRVLAEGASLDESLAAVVEAVGSAMEWTFGALWRPSAGGDTLSCDATWQTPDHHLEIFTAESRSHRPRLGEGLPGSAWASGEALWIEDVSIDHQFPRRAAAAREGLHSALAIPVRNGDATLAVLEFFSPLRRRRSGEMLEMVGALGEQISAALVTRESELEAQRMKDQFFALVSHELRTPLTSIIGYVDLILDGEELVPAVMRKRLGVVDRNATRLLRLVSDLLFVAQVEAGAFQLETCATDLQNVAQTSLDALRPRAAAKGVLLVDQTDQASHVDADPDRMGQAIDNLVSNAIKFTEEGGTVTVRVLEQPDGVEIEVADSGLGIPEGDQQLLFDRFFRSSNADGIPGMGLGLAITKAIVEGHGGRLTFESSLGQGTTFRIQLPAEIRNERPTREGGPAPLPLRGEAL